MTAINHKPIHDAVRAILRDRLRDSDAPYFQREVDRVERAITAMLDTKPADDRPKLGKLSERYESGGRGPGTVSPGKADPGGVSYGTYQLASKVGTLDAFLEAEGKSWADRLTGAPGSAAFSNNWRAVAADEPDAFGEAQHAFIERTHYRKAVDIVLSQTGLDLDSRHQAIREATWSVAVQHGGAAGILSDAIRKTDQLLPRQDEAYDRNLLEAIYDVRSSYVRKVAARSDAASARTLIGVVETRYPDERARARAIMA